MSRVHSKKKSYGAGYEAQVANERAANERQSWYPAGPRANRSRQGVSGSALTLYNIDSIIE